MCLLEGRGEDDVGGGVGEEGGDVGGGVAGEAAADPGDEEGEVGFVAGVVEEFGDVLGDVVEGEGLDALVLGGDGVGLAVVADTLAADGTEALPGEEGGSAAVESGEVGPEDEDFVGSEEGDVLGGVAGHDRIIPRIMSGVETGEKQA